MAISENVSSGPYLGTGALTEFDFDFSIVTAADIGVYVDGARKTLGAHYGVTFGDTSGTVTFTTPPATATQILLVSEPDYAQASEFADQGAYNLSTINLINRRATIRGLVNHNLGVRAVKVPLGETGPTLPAAADRANKFFGFDNAGGLNLTRTFDAFDASVNAAAASAATSVAQANVATTKAGEATASASSASASATLATTKASIATAAADMVSANATNINLVAANVASVATLATDLNLGASSAIRQAGPALAQILALGLTGTAYTTTAAALAGTADGSFASVRNSNASIADLYYRQSGSLTLQRTDLFGSELPTKVTMELSASFVTQSPYLPDFSVNPIDGKLYFGGALIPNRSAPRPVREQLHQFSNYTVNGAVLTENYAADPWGVMAATRAQFSVAGNYVTLFSVASAAPSEVGDYRLVFQMKSNAGAGNQAVKIAKNITGGTVINLTEGSWTQVDMTFTLSANNDTVSILTNGTAPLDILFSKIQVPFHKEVLPSTPPVPATHALVQRRKSRPGSLSFGSGNSFVSPIPGGGRFNFTDGGSQTRSVSALTVLMVTKKTAASTGTFSSMFQTVGDALSIGDFNNQVGFKMPGLNARPVSPAWDIVGHDFVIMALRFDGTRATAHIGSLLVAAGTGGSALTLSQAIYGGSGFGDTSLFSGFGGILEGYYRYLTDSELKQAVKAVRDRHRLYGDTLGPKNILITEGDSITAGVGASAPGNAYAQLLATTPNPDVLRINMAVAGAALGTPANTTGNFLYARLPALLARIAEIQADGISRAIVSVMVGVNAIPVIADYYAYLDQIRAAGAFVLVWKITGSSDSTKDAYQTAISNAVALGHADAVADTAANANLYGSGAAGNAAYFPDGLHPSDLGHAALATLGASAFATLLA